ncbi:MAG: gamma-glutamyl-gamma-aminobutyrate hydrolase family protein [Nitrospirae bacterium]|nr:gamma-glutamyl-gamma-aminobutyrate hydrolase family protein [Nitrospirota bacterium]
MRPLIGIAPELIVENGKPGLFLDQRYWLAVEGAGGTPCVLSPTADREIVREIAARIDGLLLTGGDDIHPRYYGGEPAPPMTLSPDLRTDFELDLLREIIPTGKPVLGICLGMQVINAALGGTLIQDIPQQVPAALNHREIHEAAIVGKTILAAAMGGPESMTVPSSHHQAIERLGTGLIVSALSSDGIIEAVEIPSHPFFLAVQWHPERGLDREENRALFESFVKASISR